MGYSIFQETMVDMTYQEIEQAAARKLPVLFPTAVIEEHGPHLPLGVDTYLSYNQSRLVKKGLQALGIDSVIAPPYYWGINVASDGFAGSFSVKPETMTAVLCDSLECLNKWGFDKIFILNFHGDFKHNSAILEAARIAYEELDIGAYFLASETFLQRAGLTEQKPYVLVHTGSYSGHKNKELPPEYLDIHAGSLETSLMFKDFPDLVNTELAKSLPSSMTTMQGLKIWSQGGDKAKEITPQGYLGHPAEFSLEEAALYNEQLIATVPQIIKDFLDRN